jgi:hypothetical protein
MNNVSLTKIFLLTIFFISSYSAGAQNWKADSLAESSSLNTAINLYHHVLSPETGFYNGREYAYDLYYPFKIDESHPFFLSDQFITGSVFYNDVLYPNVPLLYDIVKDELVTRDPITIYLISLNKQRLNWFTLAQRNFIRIDRNKNDNSALITGFYEVLYNGETPLYKKNVKQIKETIEDNILSRRITDNNQYFIKINSQYYEVKGKKSLMTAIANRKNEINQFMRKNKLRLKRIQDDVLIKIVEYYDGINTNNTKVTN